MEIVRTRISPTTVLNITYNYTSRASWNQKENNKKEKKERQDSSNVRATILKCCFQKKCDYLYIYIYVFYVTLSVKTSLLSKSECKNKSFEQKVCVKTSLLSKKCV